MFSIRLKHVVMGSVALAIVVFLSSSFSGLIYSVWGARQSNQWPRIEATVTKSGVRGRLRCYETVIQYTYAFNNKSYTGDNLVFGHTGCQTKSDAELTARHIIVGQRYAVRVNPESPQQSVFFAGVVSRDTWIGIAAFIVLGALLARGYYVRTHKPKHNPT